MASLATAYGGRLGKAWRGRAERNEARQNFQAYDYFQRGVEAFNLFTKGCTATAIQWFEKAIELDPSYGKPYAKIAWAHLVDVWLGWSKDTSFSMAEALKFATAAIQHDDDEAWGYWAMAGYHMFGGHHDCAISAYQRALELNPNDADVLNDFGQCLSFAGRATEGVEVVHKAMRLNPHYPDYWVMQLGPIYFDARRYEDAISTLEKLHSKDTIGVQLYLAASHAALGRSDQARATMASVIGLDPLATLERLAPTFWLPTKMHLIGTICGRTTSRRGCRNDAPRLLRFGPWTSNTDVRFGSLPDKLTSSRHVRFTPSYGIWEAHPSRRVRRGLSGQTFEAGRGAKLDSHRGERMALKSRNRPGRKVGTV